MKKAGFLLVFAFFAALFTSQTTKAAVGDFDSRANGNWNTAATWIKQLTGTATFVNASPAVTGVGTLFTTELSPGDILMVQATSGTVRGTVSVILTNTTLTLTAGAIGNASGAYGKQAVPTSADGLVTITNTNAVTVTAAASASSVQLVAGGGSIVINSGVGLAVTGALTVSGNSSATSLVTVNGSLSAGSLSINGGGNGSSIGRVNVNTGGSVSVTGALTINAASGPAFLDMSSGSGTASADSFDMTASSGTGGRISQVLIGTGSVTATGNYTFSSCALSFGAPNCYLTASAAGTAHIGGNLGAGGSLQNFATSPGSTIDFNGPGANSMAAYTYQNVEIAKTGGGSIALGGACTVNGGLTVTSGTLDVSASNFALTLHGNLTNNSSVNARSGTVTFNSSSAQTIGGSSQTAFSALTINNGSGVGLNTSGSVSGLLTLTTDLTANSPAVLTQSGTSAGAGDVIGKVARSDCGTTARSFGNVNVQLTTGNAAITQMTVLLIKSPAFPGAVTRTYVIDQVNGPAPSSATVRLRYKIVPDELNGNTEATLHIYRREGSTWNDVSTSAPNTVSHYIEATGISTFSTWGIGGPTAPTDIAMVGYGASHSREGKVLLQWETGREVNNLGFNVYRQDGEGRVRVNRSLIVGSGLTARPGTEMSAGRSYAWMTSAAQAKESVFWIEELDFSGRTVWHGPIQSQEVPGGTFTMSAKQQAILEQTSTVSDLADESANSGVTRPVETFATIAKPGAVKITGAVVKPSQPPIKSPNPSVKISLKQEGWYRITQPQLVAAGLNPSVNPNSLQLFADGAEVPMSVTSNNGAFDSTSAIEFYGLPIDTPSTDTHVYTLTVGAAGKRVPSVTGQAGLPPAASFLYTVERRDRSIYVSGVHNGDAENFFGSVVGSSPTNQALTLTNVDAAAVGEATIEVGMQGLSLTPHVVTVNLNGNPIGTISYDSQAQGVAQFTVANSSLVEGQNLVSLSGQPGLDLSLVDHIRVSYWHSYAADGNALKFTATANQQVTLAGFTSANVNVFDVTDPNAPAKVDATVLAQKTSPTFVVTVAAPGTGTRTLLAIGDDQTRSALTVIADKPSTWKSQSNAADLVIITHDSLKDSFAQLQALRQSQGLKVALVNVEDIYDEFSFGNKSPQAIKDFLAYAKTNWKTAPKYVLLAGSASYDPKNYNGLGGYDLVPTKLIDTSFSETASDDFFADFNLDGIAEMAVGRLPVPTSEEAQTTVAKLAAYQNGDTFNSSLLVADDNLDFDFVAANASLAALFPGSITVQQINRGQIGTAAAKLQLLTGIASGQKIVNYVGHGSPSVWRDNLLTAADAAALTNTGRYPVFITMTCLNGEFQHPELNPLASALMNSREGGAIAVWASSGFTIPAEQAVMNQQFYTLLFQSNQPVKGKAGQAGMTLGEITNSAKSSVTDPDIRRTWILFGDPSMRVK